jgi:D-3-phosphoglycerate dehydrogenase
MSSTRPRIVVSEPYAPESVARLRRHGEVIELDRPLPDVLREHLREADALLVRTYVEVTDDLLAAAPRLRVIGRGGVGIDNIDAKAAARRGITVVYTPAASTRSVAEHTFGLLLALLHRLVDADRSVRENAFHAFRGNIQFRELRDLTLGIVGMGRIGSFVGRIAARGFDMRVIYNDVARVGPFDFPTESVSKAELYAAADVITLHVPLTASTRRLIDAASLAVMRPTALLINTSRGAVVDLEAVAAALLNDRLGGAALDVFDPEPLPTGHPLLAAPRTLLSPHMAGRSARALKAMNDVVDDVIAVLEGRPPDYPAGPDA